MRAAITGIVLLLAALVAAGARPAAKPTTKPSTRPVARQDRDPAAPATRVVFLCNASASMKTKWPSMQLQLSSAVGGLAADQKFNIVFWQDGKAVVFKKDGVVPATDEMKRAAYKFLDDAQPRGGGEAIPAITAAFAQRPDLIYLLTDSDFPDNDAVLKKVRALNAGREVKVNTIAFMNEGDTDTAIIQLLETIARESDSGTFKKVIEKELKQE